MFSKTQLPVRPVRISRRELLARLVLLFLLAWLAGAYVLMPAWWKRYAHRHPGLQDIPGVTYTADSIPADPINVGLIGTKVQLIKIMLAARWYPADPLTLRSSLRIAAASVFKRPYEDAPVSAEYLFGRREDVAFEHAVGNNPRHRHHVRFWETGEADPDGRPLWVGAAIFDERVGLSRMTGQITHKTAPNIDAERGKLFADLEQTGDLVEFKVIHGFHKVSQGRNGQGNPWYTDGNLYFGVISTKLISPTKTQTGQ
jgi:hypothetical protein